MSSTAILCTVLHVIFHFFSWHFIHKAQFHGPLWLPLTRPKSRHLIHSTSIWGKGPPLSGRDDMYKGNIQAITCYPSTLMLPSRAKTVPVCFWKRHVLQVWSQRWPSSPSSGEEKWKNNQNDTDVSCLPHISSKKSPPLKQQLNCDPKLWPREMKGSTKNLPSVASYWQYKEQVHFSSLHSAGGEWPLNPSICRQSTLMYSMSTCWITTACVNIIVNVQLAKDRNLTTSN